MRKVLYLAAVFLLLTSCASADPHQQFIDIRTAFLSGDAELSADLTVDYGDRCYEYRLAYTGDGKIGEVTVLEPDIINGISVKVDEKKQLTVKCDDVLIDTGVVYGGSVTPVGAIPLMVNAIREGYVSDIYSESFDGTEYIVTEIDETPAGESSEVLYTFWFAEESKVLYKAEISVDGFMVISALFEEVQ